MGDAGDGPVAVEAAGPVFEAEPGLGDQVGAAGEFEVQFGGLAGHAGEGGFGGGAGRGFGRVDAADFEGGLAVAGGDGDRFAGVEVVVFGGGGGVAGAFAEEGPGGEGVFGSQGGGEGEPGGGLSGAPGDELDQGSEQAPEEGIDRLPVLPANPATPT